METLILNPEMVDVQFRSGRLYTLAELAELARRGLDEKSITHRRAAEILSERHDPTRGKYHRSQVTAALSNPESQPGMLLLLVETFTDYDVNPTPRYQITRKS